ncbi:putative terminal deoxynucleotidyl transferase [Aspergillus clavatus NRRL 1]|uniref:DNA-directed DNA polymerase n=1 Tax=Aspergillus clavatus (strain ATCC 1007 / CBS 513.65 / DSM 816 / NCTC 3887 / NRRL 1 / QM 1276 / 107) TaxID=344612 RepID=A1CSU7_ASPCL|nr:terminal deoxynucleotidyl transferase, putative [Aspergillus clavatus NRRL 1]EAW06384.1 terminal deoxynucleotidyl transferase, putative [Aspergillus clavatus NRRL 1]
MCPPTTPPPTLTTSEAHLFSPLPPIYVLPTHLPLDTLHTTEDALVHRAARLTYDAAEAGLVLGKLRQKKRAVLELRTRGVWTTEVERVSNPGHGVGGLDLELGSRAGSARSASASVSVTGSGSPEPVAKRQRVESAEDARVRLNDDGVVDLATERESEEEGGGGVRRHLRVPESRARARSKSVASTATAPSGTDAQGGERDVVTVVRLDWVEEVLRARRLVAMAPFVVYQGRKVAAPTPAAASAGGAENSKAILQRAEQDAIFKPPAAASSRFTARRSREPLGPGHQPPKLYQQTTSEHDEAAPLPPAPDWVRDRVMYACMRSAPLHPPNEAFIAQLVKIRTVRELTLDEIGVRAYSTSIAALAAYPSAIQRPAEILTLPGCDAKIAALFAEFQASADGTVAAAAALDSDPALRTLHLFGNIWGVGAKTARDFLYQRHWRDLDDLVEHGWAALSRVQQIGLKYYDEFLAGVPRPESEAIARTVAAHAARVRPHARYDARGLDCVLVGGYRRGKPLSGDVDLVLSHRDESVTKNLVLDLVRSLEAAGYITHTLALHMTSSHRDQQPLPYRGDDEDDDDDVPGRHFDTLDKALVVWQDPDFDDDDGDDDDAAPTLTSAEAEADDQDENQEEGAEARRRRRNPNPHRRVDIIISPWRTVGCAVLGWSGDTTFQRDLRRYAKKAHGWKFDSSGVRQRTTGGHVVDLERGGETWQERERLVLEGLGVGWRPPEERCTR